MWEVWVTVRDDRGNFSSMVTTVDPRIFSDRNGAQQQWKDEQQANFFRRINSKTLRTLYSLNPETKIVGKKT